jgi:hypothetical protein
MHPRVDHQAAQPHAADADDEPWPLDERREPSLSGEENGQHLPTRDNVPLPVELDDNLKEEHGTNSKQRRLQI